MIKALYHGDLIIKMKTSNYFRRKSCRLCRSNKLSSIINLQSTPPANQFVKIDSLGTKQAKYPLEVFFCKNCAHVQLLDVVNPEELFRDYVYVSGTSPVFVNHFKDYANDLMNNYEFDKNKLILDIGSNDGTLLSFFKEKGHKVLGVDPAKKIAEKATKGGIETISDFFNLNLAKRIKKEYSTASLITANNVFAHADDLIEIINGIKFLLSENGIFVFEVSYLLDVFDKTLFDTIYHEHLSYHSVKPLKNFFSNNGMELIDVKRINTHGGSIRCVAKLKESILITNNSVTDLIKSEENCQLDKADTFIKFALKIQGIKNDLKKMLCDIKKNGQKIAAFGAPAKATTLMYEFGLDKDTIEFIIDDNPLKQGLYSPGLHIPVYPSSILEEKKVDYLMILAWNFADPIIKKNQKFISDGGKFIVPLPEIKIY